MGDRKKAVGCVIVLLVWVGVLSVLTVALISYVADHPGFFMNKTGWAETIAFLSGFLSPVIGFFGLVAVGYLRRGQPRTPGHKAVAWTATILALPALTITGAFALTALPGKSADTCDVNPQQCAYLHQHPFVILAVIAGALAGLAVFLLWWSRKRPGWARAT